MENLKTFEELRELINLMCKLNSRLVSISTPLQELFSTISIEEIQKNNWTEINKIDKIFLELLICDSLIDSLVSVEMDICIMINRLRKQIRAISQC